MHVTKRFILAHLITLGLIWLPLSAEAKPQKVVNEHWLIVQGQYLVSQEYMAWMEFIRRDRQYLGSDEPFLDLLRLSFGWRITPYLSLTLGISWVDFKTGTDEFRTNQFLFYQHYFRESDLFVINRLGLEQRFFNDDGNTYWRLRYRVQLQFFQSRSWGLSAYVEPFIVLEGNPRFVEGWNENRWGIGPRYRYGSLQAALFYGGGFLEQPKQQILFDWWQLQLQFSLE